VRQVPIPDPTPDDPEPVRVEQPRQDFDIPIDDLWVPHDVEIPPAPEVEPDGPIIWRPELTRPEKISGPNPIYPEVAVKAGLQGAVILECIIDSQGSVRVNKVLREQPLGMTEAAIAAVEKWRFEPSLLDGKPVDVIYVLTVIFRTERR
jgi:protein TonB